MLNLIFALLATARSSLKPQCELALENLALRQQVAVLYWRWKSRAKSGRPKKDTEIRDLIRRMAKENPTWGAPRVHGELLKLGTEVSEATVSRYMPRRRNPPSQTWRTFLLNHAKELASADFFVVPTATFRVLYVFIVLDHERVIGSIRRECLNHVIILGEQHLRRILDEYVGYYHTARTHLSLAKDAPVPRPVIGNDNGNVVGLPMVGGLHHKYVRRAA